MDEREARVLIFEFEEAVKDLAWRGFQLPEDRNAIDSNYASAKKELLECLLKLTTDPD